MERLRLAVERVEREQTAEGMNEQRLAIGVDPVALADFGAQLAGQEIHKLVETASPRGYSEACSGRRVVHHDAIFRALREIVVSRYRERVYRNLSYPGCA